MMHEDLLPQDKKKAETIIQDRKEAMLRFTAYAMLPVSTTLFTTFGRSLSLAPKQTKELIAELVEEGRLLIYPEGGGKRHYLPYEDYPRYFMPATQEEETSFSHAFQSSTTHTRYHCDIRSCFYGNDDKHSEQAEIFTPYLLVEKGHMIPLLAHMLTAKPWHGILAQLSDALQLYYMNIIISILEHGCNISQKLNCLNTLAESNLLKGNPLAFAKSVQHYFFGVLKGNLASTSLLPAKDASCYQLYAQALNFQYNGDYIKALTLYNKGISKEHTLIRSQSFYLSLPDIPLSPFFSMMYLLALSTDHRAISTNKLSNLHFRLCSDAKAFPPSAQIYLPHLLEQTNSKHHYQYKLELLPDLDFVLCAFIIKNFNIGKITKEQEARAVELIEQNEWSLLALEFGCTFKALSQQREELSTRLGLAPHFHAYVKLEEWQKQLTLFDKLVKTQKGAKGSTKKATAQQEFNRIIYLIEPEGKMTPVLQKSKDGQKWSKGRNIALNRMFKGNVEHMSEIDKAVALTIECYSEWRGHSYYLGNTKSFETLINHPHLYLASNPDISVQIVQESPYIEIISSNKGFTIHSNVKTNENETLIVARESDVLHKVFKLTNIQRDIIKLFEAQNTYPLKAKDSLTKLLGDLSSFITIHSDLLINNEELRQKQGSSKISVQILPMAEGVKVELFSKRLEDYPPYFKAGKGMEVCLAEDEEGKVNIKRNLTKESSNYRKVRDILREVAQDQSVEDTLLFDDMYDCLELLDQLQGQDKILRIEWPKGARLKIRGKADFDQLNLSAFSRGQWLQIDGEIVVDKQLQLSLSELLERSRKHQGRFVELAQGEYLALSKKLRAKLAEVDSSLTQSKKGDLQLSTFRSDLLTHMEDEGASITADKKYQELQKRIQAAYDLNVQIPPTLTAQLRDYQIDGYEWLSRLAAWGAGACLADDMGLGKSIQSIAVMLDRATQGPSLIVAPASVVPNWQREIARFAPSLHCHQLHDKAEQRAEIIESAAAFDVVITTYGLLSRIDETLKQKQWNVILLDEAHNIKNRDTKSSKTAMALQGQFRLALTGTPIQNHLGEIWNLFQFTNAGLLGSYEQFKDKFIIPIEKEKNRNSQQQLKRIIQPFLLRRTKSEVLDELPAKTEIIHHVELSAEERAVYETIRQNALLNLEQGELNPIQTLAEITKLRQAACHPLLVNKELPIKNSSKIKRLHEIVDELLENKHRALIFSQFTSFLGKVAESLDERGIPYCYLDGQTPIKERERLVEEFQQGKTPLFLISLKAGGTGLNLTAADFVIHMDPWWNPAIEDQASDRSHRIGQTRPVTIYKLIATQSIEERILEMHKNKKSLSDSLLEGGNMSNKLTKKEIMAMLQDCM